MKEFWMSTDQVRRPEIKPILRKQVQFQQKTPLTIPLTDSAMG